ncbi:MetQ/NlpA family ABC transporter substrate-binding protein [uncultured Anaerococcus sp.]|uniref:MetQ/NlpA family ABC transporter substrate-binding protein n=1 Tax=uncultured Anaerococcus sp. TaxID=293428 RepID=UPI0025DB9715|nr:MetQ/NlpA family ABC transporter substrate-binding protein [uncultured Anaerococcus sp.]
MSLRKIALSLLIIIGITGCGSAKQKEATEAGNKVEESGQARTFKFGVVGERNEPWEEAIKKYEEDTGNSVEIIRFSDYNQPNHALKDGDIDLSSFATRIFIEEFNQSQNAGFYYIADTVISPMGIYSSKLEDYKSIPDGGSIAIPVEVSNNSRALYILDAAGLIKVKEDAGDFITLDDIAENPKNIEFIELPADQVSRSLEDVDQALINSDMAMEAGFIPTEDAIYLENPNHERSKNFINVIAVKEENKDDKDILDLVNNYFLTDETKEIYEREYKGSVICMW